MFLFGDLNLDLNLGLDLDLCAEPYFEALELEDLDLGNLVPSSEEIEGDFGLLERSCDKWS